MIKAVGPRISFPISPAVVAGNIFFATNVPVDLQTGHFVGGPIETQARQVFGNLEALLKEAGGSLSDVAQITIYLTDPRWREAVYRTIGQWLRGVYPVSTGIVVAGLARPEWLVEVDVIAVIPD